MKIILLFVLLIFAVPVLAQESGLAELIGIPVPSPPAASATFPSWVRPSASVPTTTLATASAYGSREAWTSWEARTTILRSQTLSSTVTPEGPGFGVELDWGYIEKHQTGRSVFE